MTRKGLFQRLREFLRQKIDPQSLVEKYHRKWNCRCSQLEEQIEIIMADEGIDRMEYTIMNEAYYTWIKQLENKGYTIFAEKETNNKRIRIKLSSKYTLTWDNPHQN